MTNNVKHCPFPEIKFFSDNVSYVMFTDDVKEGETERDGWQLRKIDAKTDELPHYEDMNKYVKWHACEYFKGKYDYAIYIDSKFEILEDPVVIVQNMRTHMPFGLAMHTYDWVLPGFEDNVESV